jgi:hypothetical protein
MKPPRPHLRQPTGAPESTAPPGMKIDGLTFQDQEVVLDFHRYKGCTFRRCKVVYHGFGAVGLDHCTFEECTYTFAGPAAQALDFMAKAYGAGGGFRELIESAIQDIRSGRMPPS